MGYDADHAIKKARALSIEHETHNPWKLVNWLPMVLVRQCELGNNILGYTVVAARMSIINLNHNMPNAQSTSVLAHELGHALLTRDTSTNYFYRDASVAAIGSAEYMANCFMFQLLFGNRGGINPMNRILVLDQYGLPHWMARYFDLIK